MGAGCQREGGARGAGGRGLRAGKGRSGSGLAGRGVRNGPRGKEAERTGPSAELGCGERGKEGVGRLWLGFWAGLVSPFLVFLPLFFSKQHSNLFEFKSNLNSNSYALKQIKLMHQHECTNKLALK